MKVAVLLVDSPEREVSARSAQAVADAARLDEYDVIEIKLLEDFTLLDSLAMDTIVLPTSHGVNAEDGWIQAELEKRRLPYLGSDSSSSKNCFDKWQARKIIESSGISMPKAVKVTKQSFSQEEISKKPFVLKILNGGSSIGILVVRNPNNLNPAAIEEIFEMERSAVLEELIEGTEITIPILDKQALPVIEIIPPQDAEFDYENKYNGATQEIVPPKNVSKNIQKQAQVIAEQVHKVMGCRHLSRIDMMLDQNNNLFVLEINTMPGLTNQSLYPKSAQVAGMDMPQLVSKFIEMVKRDYNL